MPRDLRYEWAYIFGAVCLARACAVALVLPETNTLALNLHLAMNLHLAEISRNVQPGAHAIVTLDGAGWHQTGGKLRVPDNISLLHLPPYSPELNPVENVWQYLRQNYLSHRRFPAYDDIVDACCHRLERPYGHAQTHPVHRDTCLGIGQSSGALVSYPRLR